MRYVCLVSKGLRVLHAYVSGFQFVSFYIWSLSHVQSVFVSSVLYLQRLRFVWSPCVLSTCLHVCLFPWLMGWDMGKKNLLCLIWQITNWCYIFISIFEPVSLRSQILIKHNIQFLFRKVNKGNLHLKTASKYFFL